MVPARGPQTVCLMQSLFCNHSAIFALQSFAMQPLLFCNLCYAIFAMQSLLCNLCYAIFAFLCFLTQSAENTVKPLLFAIFCWKYWKTVGFPWFCTQIAKDITKPVLFAIFCCKCWQTFGFPLFFALILQKTLKSYSFFAIFPYKYLHKYPWQRPGRPPPGSVSYNPK